MAIVKNQRTDSLKGKVFVPRIPGTLGGYIYVRDVRGREIRFSIMDKYVDNPVFNDCGMFAISSEDFNVVYEPYNRR